MEPNIATEEAQSGGVLAITDDCGLLVPVVVTPELVASVLEEHPSLSSFNDIQAELSRCIGRRLTTKERKAIASYMNKRAILHAQQKNEDASHQLGSVLIITAYSDDYAIGSLCETINRIYAERHGYKFESEVIPYRQMLELIAPRAHCAWYKALLILRYLEKRRELLASGITYLLWIDADAIFIDHTISLGHFIDMGRGSDLIISEDIHKGCLINSGVMLVRLTDWSHALWHEVWTSERSKRYHDVYFYDQSALMRALRARDVGLEQMQPFHSFDVDGPKGPKFFRHVCVLTHLQFNTNAGIPFVKNGSSNDEQQDCIDSADHGEDRALFVFHALGPWNKMDALVRAVQIYRVHRFLNLSDTAEHNDEEGGDVAIERVLALCGLTATQVAEFRLKRGRCGTAPTLV